MANATQSTIEVVMLTRIDGPFYVETGRNEKGESVMESHEWPAPGGRITLPRQVALDLIHNEKAYPASLKRRPKDRTEALVAAGVGA